MKLNDRLAKMVNQSYNLCATNIPTVILKKNNLHKFIIVELVKLKFGILPFKRWNLPFEYVQLKNDGIHQTFEQNKYTLQVSNYLLIQCFW